MAVDLFTLGIEVLTGDAERALKNMQEGLRGTARASDHLQEHVKQINKDLRAFANESRRATAATKAGIASLERGFRGTVAEATQLKLAVDRLEESGASKKLVDSFISAERAARAANREFEQTVRLGQLIETNLRENEQQTLALANAQRLYAQNLDITETEARQLGTTLAEAQLLGATPEQLASLERQFMAIKATNDVLRDQVRVRREAAETAARAQQEELARQRAIEQAEARRVASIQRLSQEQERSLREARLSLKLLERGIFESRREAEAFAREYIRLKSLGASREDIQAWKAREAQIRETTAALIRYNAATARRTVTERGAGVGGAVRRVASTEGIIAGALGGGVLSKLSHIERGVTRIRTGLFSLYSIAALLGTGFLLRAFIELDAQLNKVSRTLETVTGSFEDAQMQLKDLNKFSNELGISFLDTADRYARFASAAKGQLNLDEIREVFDGVTKASVALGLSEEDVGGVFKAIEQMAGKGVVSLEELRGQLGERLPPAIRIMAREMGMSIGAMVKMIEQGDLLSRIALPKLAKGLEKDFGAAAARAADDVARNIARVGNAWDAMITRLLKEGARGRAKSILKEIAEGLASPEVIKLFKELSSLLGDLVGWFSRNSDGISNFATLIVSAFRLIGEIVGPILEAVLEQLRKGTQETKNFGDFFDKNVLTPWEQIFNSGMGMSVAGAMAPPHPGYRGPGTGLVGSFQHRNELTNLPFPGVPAAPGPQLLPGVQGIQNVVGAFTDLGRSVKDATTPLTPLEKLINNIDMAFLDASGGIEAARKELEGLQDALALMREANVDINTIGGFQALSNIASALQKAKEGFEGQIAEVTSDRERGIRTEEESAALIAAATTRYKENRAALLENAVAAAQYRKEIKDIFKVDEEANRLQEILTDTNDEYIAATQIVPRLRREYGLTAETAARMANELAEIKRLGATPEEIETYIKRREAIEREREALEKLKQKQEDLKALQSELFKLSVIAPKLFEGFEIGGKKFELSADQIQQHIDAIAEKFRLRGEEGVASYLKQVFASEMLQRSLQAESDLLNKTRSIQEEIAKTRIAASLAGGGGLTEEQARQAADLVADGKSPEEAVGLIKQQEEANRQLEIMIESSRQVRDVWREFFEDWTNFTPLITQINQTLADAATVGLEQLGDSVANVALGLTSAKDAARDLAQTIIREVISALVKIGVQQVLNFVLGQSLAQAQAATQIATAASVATALTPIWTTPAYLATVATVGAAAAAAPAALEAGLAGSQAAMAAGSAAGTVTSFAGPRAEGGPVRGGKEYLVGERGRELFLSGGSGKMVTNLVQSVGKLQPSELQKKGLSTKLTEKKKRDSAMVSSQTINNLTKNLSYLSKDLSHTSMSEKDSVSILSGSLSQSYKGGDTATSKTDARSIDLSKSLSQVSGLISRGDYQSANQKSKEALSQVSKVVSSRDSQTRSELSKFSSSSSTKDFLNLIDSAETVSRSLIESERESRLTSVFETLLSNAKIIGEKGRERFRPDTSGVIIPNTVTEKILKNVATHREYGGSVHEMRPYIVGERGREMFIPSSSGQILDNSRTEAFLGMKAQGSGEGVQVVVNNNATGVDINTSSRIDSKGRREIVIEAVSQARKAVEQDFAISVSRGYGPYSRSIQGGYRIERNVR